MLKLQLTRIYIAQEQFKNHSQGYLVLRILPHSFDLYTTVAAGSEHVQIAEFEMYTHTIFFFSKIASVVLENSTDNCSTIRICAAIVVYENQVYDRMRGAQVPG